MYPNLDERRKINNDERLVVFNSIILSVEYHKLDKVVNIKNLHIKNKTD